MSHNKLKGTVATFSKALNDLLKAQINVTSTRISEEMDKKLFALKTDLEGKLLPMHSDIDEIKSKISP